MVDGSSERINEKIQLAMQGVMDNSNRAIAIAVRIFGVLTLLVQIAQPNSFDPYDTKSLIIWITLNSCLLDSNCTWVGGTCLSSYEYCHN